VPVCHTKTNHTQATPIQKKTHITEKNDQTKMETTMLHAAGAATITEDRRQIMM
jgi:hypothetical protein